MSDVSILTKISDALRMRLLSRRAPPLGRDSSKRSSRQRPDLLFLQARSMARFGQVATALSLLDEAIAMAPEFSEAIEARAELLDISGNDELASQGFAEARRIKSTIRQGPPDRPFAVRLRGNFSSEIDSYDNVVRSLQKNILPYLARGNAYLASGYPEKALGDYNSALKLKSDSLEVSSLKAEALLRLRRYEEALASIDPVISVRPKDADAFSTRAAIFMALARLDDANADLRRQLSSLHPGQCAARGCVALRLTAYEEATEEFSKALLRQPNDPYWRLYLGVAQIRLGTKAPVQAGNGDRGGWPQLLLAFQAGHAGEDAVAAQAISDAQRAEAWFQFGVCAIGRDRETARRYWQKVVEFGAPDLIEYGAARNELARG